MLERMTVQKEYRLRNREDFSKIYRFGKSVANHQFVIYYKNRHKDALGHNGFRVGISASKKVGNAVVRNRLRRIIKEIWRKHQSQIVPHYDYIVIVRKAAVNLDYHQLEKSMLHVLKKGSFLMKR